MNVYLFIVYSGTHSNEIKIITIYYWMGFKEKYILKEWKKLILNP